MIRPRLICCWHYPEIDSDVSRRFLLVGGGATAVAVLSGCGRADSGPDQPSTDRTVASAMGDVTLPMNPKRVVCADFFVAFAVVDAGTTPVGVCGEGYDGTGEVYEEKLADAASVGDFTEPNLESVAAQKPDLIIRSIETERSLYDQLRQIAPTYILDGEGKNLVERSLAIGAAVGRRENAENLRDEFDTLCEEVRSKRADVLADLTFAQLGPFAKGSVFVAGPAWSDMEIWAAAGIRFPEVITTMKKDWLEASLEDLDTYASADVLLIPAGPDGKSAPDNTALTESPLWSTLPAAKAGRVYPILTGASSLGNAIDQLHQLDQILAELP